MAKRTIFFTLSLAALYQTLFLLTRAQLGYGYGNGAPETLPEDVDIEEPHYGDSYADTFSEWDVPGSLQQILKSNNSAWTYPTALTRDIIPKPLHSHNDYWRDVPFYQGLSVGAISTEADIWLYNDTLYVGHEQSALTPARTLQSLYLDPIMATLKRQNPTSAFVGSGTHNGVFDTSSGQTLYLWLDVKTSGNATFAAAIAALEPLRAAGFLTTYSPEAGVTRGPVTVTGTGNTPISYFTDPTRERWYFFDAELPQLGPGGAQETVTSNMTQIASTDFMAAVGAVAQNDTDNIFSASQLSGLRSQIAAAKAKGIGARYWDTPGWPVRVRNGVWRTLWEEGVALINVDDLQAAAFTEW